MWPFSFLLWGSIHLSLSLAPLSCPRSNLWWWLWPLHIYWDWLWPARAAQPWCQGTAPALFAVLRRSFLTCIVPGLSAIDWDKVKRWLGPWESHSIRPSSSTATVCSRNALISPEWSPCYVPVLVPVLRLQEWAKFYIFISLSLVRLTLINIK